MSDTIQVYEYDCLPLAFEGDYLLVFTGTEDDGLGHLGLNALHGAQETQNKKTVPPHESLLSPGHRTLPGAGYATVALLLSCSVPREALAPAMWVGFLSVD